MPKLTLENCKAPRYEEFPKLAKVRANTVLDQARDIKLQIAALTKQLAALQPKIQAKVFSALDEDVTSFVYEDMLVTRRKGYERRSLDKKWATKKLLSLKVKPAEIEEHTTVSVVEPGVSLQLLGEDEVE